MLPYLTGNPSDKNQSFFFLISQTTSGDDDKNKYIDYKQEGRKTKPVVQTYDNFLNTSRKPKSSKITTIRLKRLKKY